jgi:hypothetical protein
MKKTMSVFVAEPYTNRIGQVLNPGDMVVAVTTGRGFTNVFTGKFAGVRQSIKTNKVVGVKIEEIPMTWNEYVFSEDGEHEETKYDWNLRKVVKTGRRYNLVPKTVYRTTSLKRNRLFRIDTSLSEVKDDLI